VATSAAGLAAADGPLAYGMTFVKAARHRAQTGVGPARALAVRFSDREGRELELTLRVTDMSAFCAVRQPRKRKQAGRDLSVTRFPEGSVLLGQKEAQNAERRTLNAQRLTLNGPGPEVRFTPGGKVVAFWRHGTEQHAVFFDRPGDLAERRFDVLEQLGELEVRDGRQGCEHLFLTLPFIRAESAPGGCGLPCTASLPEVAPDLRAGEVRPAPGGRGLPMPVFGERVTPAFRAAFELMLRRESADDDFQVMRGEPGEFAVAARRQGAVWRVGGVTAAAQTLTVRFEDLWLRTPAGLRAPRYRVDILRDPNARELADSGTCGGMECGSALPLSESGGKPPHSTTRVEEAFAAQAPDVRVALDLARDGGFLLTFTPEEMSHG
jgi:hypothetical protein